MAVIEAPFIYVAGWFLPPEDRRAYQAALAVRPVQHISVTV